MSATGNVLVTVQVRDEEPITLKFPVSDSLSAAEILNKLPEAMDWPLRYTIGMRHAEALLGEAVDFQFNPSTRSPFDV